MKKNIAPILGTLSLALLIAAAPVADAKTKSKTFSTEVSEALAGNSVKAKLIDKLGMDALGISVSVSGTTATLTGRVTKQASQGLAEQVALSVKGIKKVDNKVETKTSEGAVVATEASVKNVALEIKVKNILLAEIGTNALKIEVEVVDGVVSLRGKLDNPDVAKAALKKTRAIKGVKEVVNLLS